MTNIYFSFIMLMDRIDIKENLLKIIVDVPKHLLSKIRNHVDAGEYSSPSEFFIVAAENQLIIENSSEDIVSINNQSIGDMHISGVDNSNPNIDPPLLDQYSLSVDGEAWDSWIWGQTNRILPIKFALRRLAIMSAAEQNYPVSDSFRESTSKRAREFGKKLLKVDEKLEKRRDERLSTGFPIGKDERSSRNRYWTQFIGYEKSDGEKTGAFFELAFADLVKIDGKNRIGLTQAGFELSQLTNPVIDNNDYSNSLSNDESSYYIKHTLSHCPGEGHLFRLILELLRDGKNKRIQLNNEIGDEVEGSGWSEGLISTQRSGAISRMYELGLIEKARKGLEVRYQITGKGHGFLD